MKNFLLRFFWAILLVAIGAVSQLNAQVEDKAAVTAALNSYFDPSYFKLEELSSSVGEGGGKKYSATASFFSKPSVNLSGELSGENKVSTVVANFPAEAKINIVKSFPRVMDIANLRECLPQTLVDNANLNLKSFTLKLGPDGKSFESFAVDFATDEWDFMSYGGLKLKSFGLTIRVVQSGEKKVLSGEIKGNLVLGQINVQISSTIPTKKEELVFKGESSAPISLGTLIQSIGGDALLAEFNANIPGGDAIKNIEVPAFTFTAAPATKTFSLSTKGNLGTQTLEVSKPGEKFIFSYEYLPKTDYKFERINPQLKVLDQANCFKDLRVRVTNNPSRKGKRSGSGSFGVEFEAGLVPNDFLRGVLGNNASLILKGGLDKDLNTFAAVDANLNLSLGKGWKFEGVDLSLDYKIGARSPVIGFHGSLVIPVDKTTLRLRLGLNAEPVSAVVGGDFSLESIDGKGDLKEWREPFGIPYVTFVGIKGGLSASGTTLIDNIQFGANMKLGKMPSGGKDRRVGGNVDVFLDVDIVQSKIDAKLENMTVVKVIEAFTDKEMEGALGKFLAVGIENADVHIDPSAKEMQIKGDASFFGLSGGSIDIKASKTGISAKGSMSPFVLKSGNFEFFSLTSAEDPSKGPSFSIDLNSTPGVSITGRVKILGQTANQTTIVINKSGFSVSAQGKLFGFLDATLAVNGADFFGSGSMNFSAEVNMASINSKIDELIEIIKSKSKILADMAQAALKTIVFKKMSFAGGIDKNTVNMGFNVEMQINIFGNHDISFGVNLPINIGSIREMFESFGTAIKDKIEGYFNFVGPVVEKAKEYAEKAGEGMIKTYETVKESAKQFIEEVKAFATRIINETLDAINALIGERRFDGPVGGQALDNFNKGYQRFTFRIDRIRVVVPTEGDGDELYGQIFALPIASDGSQILVEPNANLIYWGASENDPIVNSPKTAGGTVEIGVTKNFYFKYGSEVIMNIKADIWEREAVGNVNSDPVVNGLDGLGNAIGIGNIGSQAGTAINAVVPDQEFSSNSTLKISAGYEGTYSATARVDYGGSPIYEIDYTLVGYPMSTGARMLDAVRTKNMGALKDYMKKGGNLFEVAGQALDIAVANRDCAMIELACKYRAKPTTTHLRNAGTGTYDENVINLLMLWGAIPELADLDLAINNNSSAIADKMLAKGLVPTSSQMSLALQKGNYYLADKFAALGAKATAPDLDLAIRNKDEIMGLYVLFHGSGWNAAQLGSAIDSKLWKLADVLVLSVAPDQNVFAKCAAANNTAFFNKLCQRGVPITTASVGETAIGQGNMEILRMCLSNGLTGGPLMKSAVAKGNLPMIDLCLANGGNPNEALAFSMDKPDFYLKLLVVYGADGNNALKMACDQNNLKRAGEAITYGKADPNTVLAELANAGKWEFVAYIIGELKMGDINLVMPAAIKRGYAPIKDVAGADEMVGVFIEMGADPTRPEWMTTAISVKDDKVVAILLENGADPNVGMAPAMESYTPAIIKLLLRNGARPGDYISVPAAKGDLDMVKEFINAGANPNPGMPPAIDALNAPIVKALLDAGAKAQGYMEKPSKEGNLDIVKALVEHGANPNDGLNPSVASNQYRVAYYLIADQGVKPRGYVVTAVNNRSDKMVNLLCYYGDDPKPGMIPAIDIVELKIVKLLVEEYGIDPKDQTYLVRTVEMTSEGTHASIAEYLLSKGADPNVYRSTRNDYSKGYTLLHEVCEPQRKKDRDLAMVKVLVAYKADPNVKSAAGWTPLHVAANKSRKDDGFDIVKVLVEVGKADVNALTGDGKSVLQVADGLKLKNYLKDHGAERKPGQD